MAYKIIYSGNCFKLEEDINDWCNNLGYKLFSIQFNTTIKSGMHYAVIYKEE